MESLKNVEIGFRRLLLRVLALFIKRGKLLPPEMDFNNCKFLFVRQDRIGDVLVSTPLFAALKGRYQSATVDILLSRNNSFVLDNEPLIRKRWVYDKNLFSIIKLLQNMRAEHYDFVIDLMDNPSATSTLLLALAGGAWNVGLAKENSYVYDVNVPLLSRKDTHIVDRLLELLKVFKVAGDKTSFRLRYQVAASSAMFAEEFWRKQDLIGRAVIGANISPANGARYWGVKNFRDLLKSLQEVYSNNPILLLFDPSEKIQAAEIAMSFPNVILSPETHSFDQFAALIQRLSLLVTPDTSAVHLAAAFQIPSVVLYVQSNKDLRIWDPYNAPSETLVTDVDDLTTIPPQKVLAAIRRLFADKKQNPSALQQTMAMGS